MQMLRLIFRQPYRIALQRAFQQSCRQKSNHSSTNKNNVHGLPPNVIQAGFGRYIIFLTPLAIIGSAITYAKYDPKFRRMLEKYVPGSDRMIELATFENKPFENVSKQIENVTKKVGDAKSTVTKSLEDATKTVGDAKSTVTKTIESATSTVTGLFGSSDKSKSSSSSSNISSEEIKPKKTIEVKKEAEKSAKPAKVAATVVPAAAASTAKPPAAEEKVKTTADWVAQKSASLPKDVVELEKLVEVAAEVAIKEYNKAITILKSFNEDVRNVVDKAVDNLDNSLWTKLKNRTSARDTSVATAEKMARDALEKIAKCEVALSKAANADNQSQVEALRSKIRKITEHINNVKDELYEAKDLASVSEKYWQNVKKARNYFIDEIESLFPGVNMSEKQLNLSKEDLDIFIMHAYSHVLAYQKELQRLQTDGELRLKRAIDAVHGSSDSKASKAQLAYMLEEEKRKLALENQRRIFQLRAETEKALRQELKHQAEAHHDHLKEVIAIKETELKRNYEQELESKLEVERANYKLQLSNLLGKMRGMDAALEERVDSERSAQQAQALWAACQALWASIRSGEPGVHWRQKLRSLKSEITAVSKVAEGDELVSVVIASLPPEVVERGVFTEDALRERFVNVERMARKVALVPAEGGTLLQYCLSQIQAFLILRPDEPVSQAELQNLEFDYSKLDTYDILNRARYFVDRGDLMQALKYMNLLDGASRKIASDWLKETRLLLETQQAANVLMAHAASSGLLYL